MAEFNAWSHIQHRINYIQAVSTTQLPDRSDLNTFVTSTSNRHVVDNDYCWIMRFSGTTQWIGLTRPSAPYFLATFASSL